MSTSPFFYFKNFEFDAKALIKFVEAIPDTEWYGPFTWKEKINTLLKPEDRLPTFEVDKDTEVKWWMTISKFMDFTKCEEVNRIAEHFTVNNQPIFSGMAFKKTQKNYVQPFRPLMQNAALDASLGIIRTFDIVIPIKGGFKESPVEALDTLTNTIYATEPTGKAYMLKTNPDWHYRWEETVEDFRYTLHLRGVMPHSYENIKKLYDV